MQRNRRTCNRHNANKGTNTRRILDNLTYDIMTRTSSSFSLWPPDLDFPLQAFLDNSSHKRKRSLISSCSGDYDYDGYDYIYIKERQ